MHQRQPLGPTPGGKGRHRVHPLDNAFATVDDPAGLQQICDRLGPDQINALLDKWLAILPGPFTDADRAAGYRYEKSHPARHFEDV